MGFNWLVEVWQMFWINVDVEMLNILLWAVITIYGVNWISNFYTVLPEPKLDDDEEILWYWKPNFTFWLTTSIIFYFYGLSQITQPILVRLTFIELIAIIITYAYLFVKKELYRKNKEEILKKFNKWY